MTKTFVPAALVAAACALGVPRASAADAKSSFGPTDVDKTVDPCQNFYQYACGTWLAKNPIPSDEARWGRFNELQQRNEEVLRGILEKASVADPKRDAIDQKIGDYYASCMDEPKANSLGTSPLKADFGAVATLKTKAELPALVARLRSHGVGVFASFESVPDFKDPKNVIADVDQGGLGLADRDMYLKDDAHSQEMRKKYLAHVQKMLVLLGDKEARGAAEAKVIMDLETALAKASMDRVARREPANLYHKMTTKELASLSPAFSWEAFFKESGAPAFPSLNVIVPDFVKGMNAVIERTDVASLKTYLRWHVLSANAPLLSKPFVDQNFDFYGKTMTGAAEIQPRWKRCVQAVDGDLGDALGERYVALTFGAEGKARTVKMVNALEKALARDIADLPWMTPATKAQADVKLRAITNKVGYPEHWRDYTTLTIDRTDLVGNSIRANAYEFRRELAKIGTPLDRTEWDMSPPTVNADYNPTHNDINFPAGILQPPFYDNAMDDAVNFGGIGAVIGHELTHGFDDSGRKFAADGGLSDWWTDADAKEFEKRAQCIVDEYAGFSVVDDLKLNGKLTLGENTADNGGLRIALMALLDTEPNGPSRDGFTPAQRFFLGWGQVWCESQHDELARLRVQVDPHSPSRDRVNGALSNMPEFQKAFGCKAGSPMVRENMCRVW
jgi:putative endopeptidase